MATKAKRKYVPKNYQEKMLKACCYGLGDNENTFLGHRFLGKDEVDAELIPVMTMIMMKIMKGMMMIK